MTQPPQPPPDDFPPGTSVRRNDDDPIGVVVAEDSFGDGWWNFLQLRGVAADQQVLVEWPNSIRSWHLKTDLTVAPPPPVDTAKPGAKKK